MQAYHNDPAQKTAIIATLEDHAAHDRLVKGKYWEGGKGCAVGCTIQSSNHAEYEPRFGIPQMLARLEDTIFEGLPNADAMRWPVRFMSAIPVGADLSLVGWQFLHWLVGDTLERYTDPKTRAACQAALDIVGMRARGEPVSSDAAYAAYAAYAADAADVSMSDKLCELLAAAPQVQS